MSNDQERLNRIFCEALDKTSLAERAHYLGQACGESTDLRRAVDSLIAAHEAAGDFLRRPILSPASEGSGAERPGTSIGRYELLQQIGEGGFGLVFMAEQQEPVRRMVALKIIKAGMDTREVVARFEAERQALALMDHPNIARVLDGGTTSSGRPYFVMDLVKGIPITDFCDQNQLSTLARLRLFLQVCAGVQHAHQKGIIHRDLKPSNVLVSVTNGEPIPKIIDFGVAKAIGRKLTEHTLFTRYEQLIGTPAYMSPEQAEWGGVDVDTRSDIYSLGVLLYELLTGTTPFEKDTLARAALDEVRRMIRETEPPTPSIRLQGLGQKLAQVAKERQTEPPLLARLVRGDLDWITMRAMEKDRGRRYETVNGLARDLERHLKGEPVSACPPSAGYRARKFIRRHRSAVAGAAVVLLALTSGLVLALFGLRQARREGQRAEEEAATARIINHYLQDEELSTRSHESGAFEMAVTCLATGQTNAYRQFAGELLNAALEVTNTVTRRMAVEACCLAPDLPQEWSGLFELTNFVTDRFDLPGQTARAMMEYRRNNLDQALADFHDPVRCPWSFLASQAGYFTAMIYFRQGQLPAARAAMDQAGRRLADCLRTKAAIGPWQEYVRAAITRWEAERLILGHEMSPLADEKVFDAARKHWVRIHKQIDSATQSARQQQWRAARAAVLKAMQEPDFDWEAAFEVSFPSMAADSLLLAHDVDGYQRLAGKWLDWQRQYRVLDNPRSIILVHACLLAPLPKTDPLFQQALAWLPHLEDQHYVNDLVRMLIAYRAGDVDQTITLAKQVEQSRYWNVEILGHLFDAMALQRVGQSEAARRHLEQAQESFQQMTVDDPEQDPWVPAECLIVLDEARQVLGETQPKSGTNHDPKLAIADAANTADWAGCVRLSRQELSNASNDEQITSAAYSGAVAGLLDSDTNAYCQFSGRVLSMASVSTNQDLARMAVELALLAPGLQTHLDQVYGLSRKCVEGDWDIDGELARGMAEYRQGNLEQALKWLEAPRHQAQSLALAAQGECFRAMILQRQGRPQSAIEALHRADNDLSTFIRPGYMGGNWHEYGRAAVIRSEAERLVLGHEVSPRLDAAQLYSARQKWDPIRRRLVAAEQCTWDQNWSGARSNYLTALDLPNFDWQSASEVFNLTLPLKVAVVCLLAGDVDTHQRLSAAWSEWLSDSPDPAYAGIFIKAWLLRERAPTDPIVLQAASWARRLMPALDDQPLIRAMVDYRTHDYPAVLTDTQEPAKDERASTVGAAGAFRAMALAQLDRFEASRRCLQETESKLAPHLQNMSGDNWWDLGLCQLALDEAHRLLHSPAAASQTARK